MKVSGINGGPRKQWNRATLVEKALEGAASAGAFTMNCPKVYWDKFHYREILGLGIRMVENARELNK